MKNRFVLCLVILISFSCENKVEIQDSVVNSIELILEEEIEIEELGKIDLWDIDNNDNKLLFNYDTWEVLLLNSQGELKSFDLEEDVKYNPGLLLSSIGFLNDKTDFFYFGRNGLFTYDSLGQFVKEYKFSKSPSFRFFLRQEGQDPKILKVGSDDYFISNIPMEELNYTKVEKEYYSNYKALNGFNYKTGKFVDFGEIPSSSKLLNGDIYELSHLHSVFTILNDRVYYSFLGDPNIYRTQKNSLNFDSTINLDVELNERRGYKIDEIENPKGFEFDVTIGGVKNIQKYKDFLLVTYYEGIPLEKKEEAIKLAENDPEAGERLYGEYYNFYKFHHLLINDSGKIVYRFETPETMDKDFILSKNGFIYFREEESRDSESVKFFKYSLNI